jgi:glycogen debranching enzyme
MITSSQVLPYRPELAETTLTTLAARQGAAGVRR